MPNANGDGSVSGGSCHGGGSRGCDGRREGDKSENADDSRDKDGSGHGSPDEILNYNVPTYPDYAEGNHAEYSTECLSGVVPSFEIELVNTHVAKRYRLPRLLPNVDVVVTLRHGRKEWASTYNGSYTRPVINKDAWKPFVDDNHLKAGDICTFELLKLCDICGVWLKVLYLKGPFDSPAERLSKTMASSSEDHAIVID